MNNFPPDQFLHSVKVPRLYKNAAKIVKLATEEQVSTKALIFDQKFGNVKGLQAITCNTIKFHKEIDTLIKRSQILENEKRLDCWLARVLIYELVWGAKHISTDAKPVQAVRAYEQIFKAHLDSISTNPDELKQKDVQRKPRYVRINTLAMPVSEAVEAFIEEGWYLYEDIEKKNYKDYLKAIETLDESSFCIDIHLPNLLVFPPRTEFHRHQGYKNGTLVLQDKASCLPVHILNPPPGSTILDMCAAPGMKTTQLASHIKNEGKIYAVERDTKRYETLKQIVENSGATCVEFINNDILKCEPTTFPNVEYILVDPSCSGSGMVGREDLSIKDQKYRLASLAGFQIKILRRALTKFPDVKRVVYSTCSINTEENEDVVRQVLETNSLFKLVSARKFVDDKWENFGSKEYGELGDFCLYAKAEFDHTDGFFVAVFERLQPGEVNQFFNLKVFNYSVIHEERRRGRRLGELVKEVYASNNLVAPVENENSNLIGVEENGDFEAPEKEEVVEGVENNFESFEKTKREKIVVEENNEDAAESPKKKKKKKEKVDDEVSEPVKKKKKRKKALVDENEDSEVKETKKEETEVDDDSETPKKKKKKNKETEENDDSEPSKKKKHKTKVVEEEIETESPKNKKKKTKEIEEDIKFESTKKKSKKSKEVEDDVESESPKKKKKKKELVEVEVPEEAPKKKKKKSKD